MDTLASYAPSAEQYLQAGVQGEYGTFTQVFKVSVQGEYL